MSSSDTPMASMHTPRSGMQTPRSGSVADSLPGTHDAMPRTPRSPPMTPSSHMRPELGSPLSRRFGRSPLATPESRARSSRGSVRSSPGSHLMRSETDGMEPTDASVEEAVVWGTNLSVSKAQETFKDFLETFRGEAYGDDDDDDDSKMGDEDGMNRLYLDKLRAMTMTSDYTLNIDAAHLRSHSEASNRLYRQLLQYPAELIPLMDLQVQRTFREMIGGDAESGSDDPLNGERIAVRVYNLDRQHKMRDLDPDDIDRLISIRGMVTRTSNLVPEMRMARFRCRSCRHQERVEVERGHIAEPSVCASCGDVHSFEIVHNMSLYDDRQVVKMQETPESIPEGETPHTVTLVCHANLVDVARPGDRVEITGVFRARPQRVNSRRRTQRAVYSTYIDVLHVQKTDKSRLSAEYAGVDKDSEYAAPFQSENHTAAELERKEAEYRAMAQREDLYEELASSLAPSIWEMDDEKKGLLCQLMGGVNDPAGKFRGEINVLLCGDPGTSKSQLLSYVNKIAPRGIYTSGKGSSAVGLTAYITKDPDTKELILESGALVLSDRGICCIDEFDKMSDSTRSILHEVMEQQTVSIAKAGIICTLNARTAVLASANPVESRYNPNRSVVDNIQLPATLVSRFDLIYLVLDRRDAARDRRLAKHIVALYAANADQKARGTFTKAQLTGFISYARAKCNPTISDAAEAALIEGYEGLRSLGRAAGGNGKKVITATPRQLESLIRLSEARARVRLSETVDVSDVEEAVRLINVATQTAATDPTTGTINMDSITTGKTFHPGKLEHLIEAVQGVFTGRTNSKMRMNDIFNRISNESDLSLSREDVDAAVQEMEANKLVHIDRSYRYNPTVQKLQDW